MLDAVSADLDTFSTMLDDSKDLRLLVSSALIRRKEQAQTLVSLCRRAQMTDVFARFLGVLAQNRRLDVYRDIAGDYQNRLRLLRGAFHADVTSAQPLRDDQVHRLREKLAARLGGTVRLTLKVNPALLGGLRVQIGSRLVDTTLRGKLDRIGLMMKGTV